MKKQWIASVLALCMLLALTGCGAAPAADTQEPAAQETPIVGEPTTESTGIESLTATFRVYNNEEITPFIEAVSAMQPASYTNTRTVDGVLTTYTLHYTGGSTTSLPGTLKVETADSTKTVDVSLFLMPYYNQFTDATGTQLDVHGYIAAVEELGMGPFLTQKLDQTVYGVYMLGGLDAMGQVYIVDFWLNEQMVQQIDFMQMLYAGME